MIVLIKSATLPAITKEFDWYFPNGILVSNNVGLITGSLFWGIISDMFGRKWAFNISLFIASIFGIAAGAA